MAFKVYKYGMSRSSRGYKHSITLAQPPGRILIGQMLLAALASLHAIRLNNNKIINNYSSSPNGLLTQRP